MSTPIALPANFEFSEEHNTLFRKLAYKMRGVGFFYFFLGILTIIFSALIAFAVYSDDKMAEQKRQLLLIAGIYFVSGLINSAIGSWVLSAARAFRKIVDTQGKDIGLLMDAMAALYKKYSLLYAVLVLGMLLFLLGIAAALYGVIMKL